MRPLLHPMLLNGRFGDPVLCLETLFERQLMLFDLGTLDALAPRQIQRIDHVFVSHAHIDHFFGFDRLLRILVGREKEVHLYGPADFADRVGHKLYAYQWNLAKSYACDLRFVVTEVHPAFTTRSVTFRLQTGFAAQNQTFGEAPGGVILSGASFRVSCAILDHRTPCLGFAVEEVAHVNIWKTELAKLGLPVGPWLKDLKRAVLADRPDDHEIEVYPARAPHEGRVMKLGALRSTYRVTPGQKIGYVTDIADTPGNRRSAIALVQGADIAFVEAPFASVDTDLAAARAHLTTRAAGEIAAAASVRHVEPFHFSPRYTGQDQRMLTEVAESFAAHSRRCEKQGDYA